MTSHYHPDLKGGTEWYHIIEAGKDAFMCTGKPIIDKKDPSVRWDMPTEIKPGDFFIIPNGVVHSLVSGKKTLRFLFGCPDAHLDDKKDKVVLKDCVPPVYKQG